MSEINLKEMTTTQLKQYLSKYRNNESKFSEALAELTSRNIWTEVSADLPLSEQEAILQKAINNKKSTQE